MSTETELQALDAKIQAGTNEHNRAQGVYDSTMARLKSEHGVETLADAQALQAKYEAEAKEQDARATAFTAECRAIVDGAGV